MSAALGQITQRITRTAEETLRASQMANIARGDAEHAGSVVHGTIKAISEIEKSSQEMAGIIRIINEIAFQTNILALNASVEAARAGMSAVASPWWPARSVRWRSVRPMPAAKSPR
jgi:methyl-accepting chemotaxis protein